MPTRYSSSSSMRSRKKRKDAIVYPFYQSITTWLRSRTDTYEGRDQITQEVLLQTNLNLTLCMHVHTRQSGLASMTCVPRLHRNHPTYDGCRTTLHTYIHTYMQGSVLNHAVMHAASEGEDVWCVADACMHVCVCVVPVYPGSYEGVVVLALRLHNV